MDTDTNAHSEETGSQPAAWYEAMLISIARDLELVKAALGIDTDAEGQIIRTMPPGEPAEQIAARVAGQLYDGPDYQRRLRVWNDSLPPATGNRCSAGCGYPVPRPGAVCGECAETGTP